MWFAQTAFVLIRQDLARVTCSGKVFFGWPSKTGANSVNLDGMIWSFLALSIRIWGWSDDNWDDQAGFSLAWQHNWNWNWSGQTEFGLVKQNLDWSNGMWSREAGFSLIKIWYYQARSSRIQFRWNMQDSVLSGISKPIWWYSSSIWPQVQIILVLVQLTTYVTNFTFIWTRDDSWATSCTRFWCSNWILLVVFQCYQQWIKLDFI